MNDPEFTPSEPFETPCDGGTKSFPVGTVTTPAPDGYTPPDTTTDPHSWDDGPPTSDRFRDPVFVNQGGMGRIFRATDIELDRTVAIKDIQPGHRAKGWSRRKFIFEAEVTGRLEHPGVVPVYSLSCGQDAEPHYAMRFIHGEPLSDAIKRFHASLSGDTLSADQALELRRLLGRFIAVCQTIAYAHSEGIIHRDLKPANVMLGPFGETLVVDWGLARRLDGGEIAPQGEDDQAVERSVGGGTPGYWAPEQAKAVLAAAATVTFELHTDITQHHDTRTDVYGLGGILFSILSNQPPNPGLVPPNPPRSAKEFSRWVDDELESICARALAWDPAQRFPSAQSLAGAVEAWLADQPVAAQRALVRTLHASFELNPERSTAADRYARSLVNLGLMLCGMSRSADAVPMFEEAARLYAGLFAANRTQPRFWADQADCYLALVEPYELLGRPADAEAMEQQANAIYHALAAAHPGDYRNSLPTMFRTRLLGQATGPSQEAGTDLVLMGAIDYCRRLPKSNPGIVPEHEDSEEEFDSDIDLILPSLDSEFDESPVNDACSEEDSEFELTLDDSDLVGGMDNKTDSDLVGDMDNKTDSENSDCDVNQDNDPLYEKSDFDLPLDEFGSTHDDENSQAELFAGSSSFIESSSNVFKIDSANPTGPRWTVTGSPVPGYQLIEQIGSGAVGEVWRCRGPAGLELAVKLIDFEDAATAGWKELRGLSRVKSLKHPNLVPVWGIWVFDRKDQLVELTDAELLNPERVGQLRRAVIGMGLASSSLGSQLRQLNTGRVGNNVAGLPIKDLLRYMEGAAKGLDYLNRADHGLGADDGPVIHCDVKPDNLLVVGGEVQISDYGTAVIFRPNMRKTNIAITPVFTTPELIRNQPHPNTDQYSLAVTYYYLRTGRVPFPLPTNPSDVLARHVSGDLEFSTSGLVDDELVAVRRATSLDPNERYSSCTRFVAAVWKAIAEADPTKQPDRESTARWTDRMFGWLNRR